MNNSKINWVMDDCETGYGTPNTNKNEIKKLGRFISRVCGSDTGINASFVNSPNLGNNRVVELLDGRHPVDVVGR